MCLHFEYYTQKSQKSTFIDDEIELYGKKSKVKLIPKNILSIHNENEFVTVNGIIFDYRYREIKDARAIYIICINDGSSSISIKIWGNVNDKPIFQKHFKSCSQSAKETFCSFSC